MRYKSRKNRRKHTRKIKNTRKGGTLMNEQLMQSQKPYEKSHSTYSLEELHSIRKLLVECGLNIPDTEYCVNLIYKLEKFIQPKYFIKTFTDISKKPLNIRAYLVYSFLDRIHEFMLSLAKFIENKEDNEDNEEDEEDDEDEEDYEEDNEDYEEDNEEDNEDYEDNEE